MHASAAALRGRTECSSHQARTLVSTPDPLWEVRWPWLVVSRGPDPQTDCQAQIHLAKYHRPLSGLLKINGATSADLSSRLRR